jgi:hypothetical protein
MKIISKLLDLATVYETLSIEKTLGLLNQMKEAKADMEALLIILQMTTPELMQVEISAVTKKIDFVNKNIKTLETAMMCHETKAIEKRTLLENVAVFYLN